jgi:hypothetical protein
MADELVDRLAILVESRRFLGIGGADSRSLRYASYMSVCNTSFVELNYLCSFLAVFGGCAARVHATPF